MNLKLLKFILEYINLIRQVVGGNVVPHGSYPAEAAIPIIF